MDNTKPVKEEIIKVNEYYGNDFSRSYNAVLVEGKLKEAASSDKKANR